MTILRRRLRGAIGLALVRYIMLSHGGSINYAPGDKGGSMFRLVF
jgi:nitrogen fixation/metabolism regulation signal transduction histidine kinase